VKEISDMSRNEIHSQFGKYLRFYRTRSKKISLRYRTSNRTLLYSLYAIDSSKRNTATLWFETIPRAAWQQVPVHQNGKTFVNMCLFAKDSALQMDTHLHTLENIEIVFIKRPL